VVAERSTSCCRRRLSGLCGRTRRALQEPGPDGRRGKARGGDGSRAVIWCTAGCRLPAAGGTSSPTSGRGNGSRRGVAAGAPVSAARQDGEHPARHTNGRPVAPAQTARLAPPRRVRKDAELLRATGQSRKATGPSTTSFPSKTSGGSWAGVGLSRRPMAGTIARARWSIGS